MSDILLISMALIPYNKRILELLEEYQTTHQLTLKDTWEKAGLNPANAAAQKSGKAGFTIEAMLTVCKMTGASADWVLGMSKTKYLESKDKDPIKVIKAALKELEAGR